MKLKPWLFVTQKKLDSTLYISQVVICFTELHLLKLLDSKCKFYPASRGFCLAWLFAFTKSFVWHVCHVVSYARETSAHRVCKSECQADISLYLYVEIGENS